MDSVYYVDASADPALADGLSETTAFASLSDALLVVSAGDTLLLRAGGRYEVDGQYALAIDGLTIDSYGVGEKPLLDARQSLGSADWTQVSDTVWKTTVTFRDAPVFNQGANSAQTTHHQVWSDDQLLKWFFGGATIEDNINSVSGNPNSFTIHATGETEPDPRDGANGLELFEVYVHVPMGGHPADSQLYLADQIRISLDGLESLSNVAITGTYGKDLTGAGNNSESLDDALVLNNVTFLDAPSHGFVGPVNATGTIEINGRGNAGHDYHEFGYNSGGGLLNLYTANRYEQTVTLETLIVSDGYKGVFGHGSTPGIPYGYDGLLVEAIYADTIHTVVDAGGLSGGVPFINTVEIGYIEAIDIYRAVATAGDAHIQSADLTFSEINTVGGRQSVFHAVGENQVLRLSNAELNFTRDINPVTQSNLFVDGTSSAVGSALLVLDNVQDISEDASKAYFFRAHADAPQTVVMGGSTLGNLHAFGNLTDKAIPSVLIVDAGSTFGLGDRTGPEIEAFLTELGVPFWISPDTTIVSRTGEVLSAPGWKDEVATSSVTTKVGDASNQALAGGNGVDVIFGLEGVDAIAGGAGNDFAYGGSDDDILLGGDGNDALFGEDGNDLLRGGDGRDYLVGGSGDDTIEGGDGIDAVVLEGFFSSFSFVQYYGSNHIEFWGVEGRDLIAADVEYFIFGDALLDLDALDILQQGYHFGWMVGWHVPGWKNGWNVDWYSDVRYTWTYGWHWGWFNHGAGWAYGPNAGYHLDWVWGWYYGWHSDWHYVGWTYGWYQDAYFGWAYV